jgi:hypothetical protein
VSHTNIIIDDKIIKKDQKYKNKKADPRIFPTIRTYVSGYMLIKSKMLTIIALFASSSSPARDKIFAKAKKKGALIN